MNGEPSLRLYRSNCQQADCIDREKPTNLEGPRNAHVPRQEMHESDLFQTYSSLVLLECDNCGQGIRFSDNLSCDGTLKSVSLSLDRSILSWRLPSEVKTMGLSGREGSDSTKTSAKPSAMLFDGESSLPVTLSTNATSTVRT